MKPKKISHEHEEPVTPDQPSDVIQPQGAAPVDQAGESLTPNAPAPPVSDETLTDMQKIKPDAGSEAAPAFQPSSVVSSLPGAPASPAVVTAERSKRSKKPLWAALAAVVVLGGAAAYYFGYLMNPSLIYSQSLSNTGKGYDKLVTYVDQQSKADNKGAVGTGAYKYTSAGFSTDGKMAFKVDDKNGEFTIDMGVAGQRVNADFRAISSGGQTGDLYIKASGLKGLGTMLGSAELDTTLASLDNTWVVIDHTLLESLQGQSLGATTSQPNREQLLDEARAFGKVNQEYIFTTKKAKAVTKVIKKHGVETVDGRKAYRYTVALQKDNVKKYVIAQRDALKASKLGAWIKQNDYDRTVYAGFDSAAKSTKGIKSSETFDVWMDVNQRVVYKVRFDADKDPAANYVDLGLNYKGGDEYPFFLSGKSKDSSSTDFSLLATLNTKTGSTDAKLNVKTSGNNSSTLTANFNFKPGNQTVRIDKPTTAKPLSQVLTELGYGDVFNTYVEALNQAAAPAPATDSSLRLTQ